MSGRLMTRPNTLAVVAVGIVACGLARLNPVWLDTVVLIGIFTLISTSAGLCYGQAGILSMGQGAFAAIGAYATAIGSTKYGIPGWVGLVFAIALPAAVAWGVARMVTGLAPLATALATLALGTMLEIVARNTDALTGGYVGIAGIPPIGGVESGQAFVMLVWVAVCVAVLLYENLMASAYGRALHTVRHDRMRANADGVAVAPLLSATLALSAAMAGVGGWLYAHYITYMSPQSLDTQVSISALLMAVIGGAGYLLGPLLGTVLLIVLGRYLPAQEAQGMFYGGALILSLLLARHGLIGLGQRWLVRRRPASARLPAPVVKPTAMRPESGIAP